MLGFMEKVRGIVLGHCKSLWRGWESQQNFVAWFWHTVVALQSGCFHHFVNASSRLDKTEQICCCKLLLRSRSELQSLGVSVYFTSQKFVACLRFTAKVCGMVRGHGKYRGVVRVSWQKFVAC